MLEDYHWTGRWSLSLLAVLDLLAASTPSNTMYSQVTWLNWDLRRVLCSGAWILSSWQIPVGSGTGAHGSIPPLQLFKNLHKITGKGHKEIWGQASPIHTWDSIYNQVPKLSWFRSNHLCKFGRKYPKRWGRAATSVKCQYLLEQKSP